MENDSLIEKMHTMMRKQFSMFNSQNHLNFIDSDSLMKQFFSDDFFIDNMPSNFPNMQNMMKHMEAMRQQFFDNRNQYIIPPEKPKKEIEIIKKQV
jgi:hypothetical protein